MKASEPAGATTSLSTTMGASNDARKTSPALLVLESMLSMVRTVTTVEAGMLMVRICGCGGAAGAGALLAVSAGAGASPALGGSEAVLGGRLRAACLGAGCGFAGSGAGCGFSATVGASLCALETAI